MDEGMNNPTAPSPDEREGKEAARAGHSETQSRDPDNGRRLETLRSGIEQTEAEMAQTLDAIQERLSLDAIKEHFQEELLDVLEGKVRHMMSQLEQWTEQWMHTVIETIKDNPVPATVMGLGATWLLAEAFGSLSRKEEETPEGRYDIEGEGIPEELYHAGLEDIGGYQYSQGQWRSTPTANRYHAGKVHDTAEGFQRQKEHLTEAAAEKVKHMRGELQNRLGQVRTRLPRAVENHKMAFSLLAGLMGFTVAALLPRSEREQKLVESVREEIVDRTRELGHRAMEKAGKVVGKAGEAAREEAERQHLMGRNPDRSREAGQHAREDG